MVRDFARELLWPCAIVLDLRHAWDCRDDVVDCDLLETVTLEEFASVRPEQIKMARAARMRSLARRRDERGADSSRPRIDSSTYNERIRAASIFDSTPITPTASSPMYATM